MTTMPFFVAGEPRTGDGTLDVTDPYDGSIVDTVGLPTDCLLYTSDAADE